MITTLNNLAKIQHIQLFDNEKKKILRGAERTSESRELPEKSFNLAIGGPQSEMHRKRSQTHVMASF